VAALTGEGKTRAIKVALQERRERLALRIVRRDRGAALRRFLEQEVWPEVPAERARPAADPAGGRRDPGLRPGRRVIVDSSAIVAIVLREPGWATLVAKLGAATMCGSARPRSPRPGRF
jgi:hypothetical protein